MEELKITFVDVELTALKLTKDHTIMLRIPNKVFHRIRESKNGLGLITDTWGKAFPGVKVIVLPIDMEVSIIEKDD